MGFAHCLSLRPPQGVPGDLGAPGPSGARVSRASSHITEMPCTWACFWSHHHTPLSFPSRAREVSPASVVYKGLPVLQVPVGPMVLLATMVLR